MTEPEEHAFDGRRRIEDGENTLVRDLAAFLARTGEHTMRRIVLRLQELNRLIDAYNRRYAPAKPMPHATIEGLTARTRARSPHGSGRSSSP